MRDVAEQLTRWLAEGTEVAIATVVRVSGSAPRPVGSTLIATTGERIAGSVSNGCVEAAVYEESMSVLRERRARVVSYGISDEMAFTVGLSCGGAIDVLIERAGPAHEIAASEVIVSRPVVLARFLSPADRVGTVAGMRSGSDDSWPGELEPLETEARDALRAGSPRIAPLRLADGRQAEVFLEAIPASALLLIVGATHIAIPLARFAKELGYRVAVADPRSALANRERFPDADEILLSWPDEALATLRPDERSAIAILSHDPKFDHPALMTALRSEAGYIGAIGSRSTNEQRFAWLRSQGFSDADIERVHAPIGLDIGARTAEETALAILAEIVAAARARSGRSFSEQALAEVS